MSQTSHQTVVLQRGRHESPDDGACVVELASMLAGEPFTDRPVSVCPVIGAVLRAYNDVAGVRRQDLYRCAAEIVGTRADIEVERRRLDHCIAVLQELAVPRRTGAVRRMLQYPLSPDRLRRLVATDPVRDIALDDFAFGLACLLRRRGDAGHDRALALVDELVAIGAPDAAPREVEDDVACPAGA